MNSYKVTYILNGEEHYDHITERTEKAAQKRVKGIYKDAEITDTELTSTDVNATKEQERETLEKIKAMVAELGPQSYLKTAFEGVYEVAEMNIDEDAAYSFPGRVNILEEQLREMGSKYNAARSDVEVLRSQLDHAQEQADALKKQQLPVWLHSAVYGLASEELATSKARMEQAAETMAYYAEAPQDIAFAEAVKGYRAAKERREVCEQIVKGLEALTEE
ncbi:hypothetical protein N510_001905 [Firmicutes bacterium ASF500]|nr:hypothetical protein N510_001905 [Firmicutes bacterium ASF500]